MKSIKHFFLIICCIIIFTACEIRHRYHDIAADINAAGTIAIAVTTYDQREYVISGKKNPNFVALQRGGFGIPFNVTTESENPLSDEMTKSIVNSLVKKGFKAIAVNTSPLDKKQAVIDKLKAAGGYRLLILTLTEWKSDTAHNIAILFDIKTEVLDQNGNIIATKEIKGRDNIRVTSWNPAGYAREIVPLAFKEKIEKLLNSKEINAALQ